MFIPLCSLWQTFDLLPSFTTTTSFLAFATHPLIVFIINKTFWRQLTCVSALMCHVCVDQRHTEEALIVFRSQHPELLAAYLPNPSSVAKDPQPCVTPSRRHLGNHCRGELPAGIADLCWLRSTELQSTSLPQDVCCWMDTQHSTQKRGGKSRLMRWVQAVSTDVSQPKSIKTRISCWLIEDYSNWQYRINGNNIM